jgi:hypothetical protein
MTHADPKGTRSGNNSRWGQKDDQGPSHPSVRLHVFHTYASTDTPWVAHALSHFTSFRYGRIASVTATHDTTQFGDSICPVCISTFNCLFIQTQLTRTLTDKGGGYHLGAPKIRSDHSPSFPSSIFHFPLIGLPSLTLNYSIIYSSSQHSTLELGYKSPKSLEWSLPLNFYRSSIH